ncbi:MAG: helix-turn-helix domain-containing protein [Erysipelotrichaceae bacterium]|nr:helix-turn-helix domain-containing protein [Erysipelotrichaceae bacterium]
MDAKKFGAFIAKCRKDQHMTQSDLAEVLHVIDKAVSRWERGVGFPDINTIEPLADALDVSILEIMKSQKIEETVIDVDDVSNTLGDSFEMIELQRKRERQSMLVIVLLVFIVILLNLYVEAWGVVASDDHLIVATILLQSIPHICLESGVVMFIYGCYRYWRHLLCKQAFAVSLCLLAVPVFCELLF